MSARKSKKRRDAFGGVFWTLMSTVFGGVAGNHFDLFFQSLINPDARVIPASSLSLSEPGFHGAVFLISAICSGVALGALGLPKLRKTFFSTTARVTRWDDREKTARAFRAIVLTLSPLRPDQVSAVRETVAYLHSNPGARGIGALAKFTRRGKGSSPAWQADPENPGPIGGSPWQQTLRLILHNHRAEPLLYFVLSKEAAIHFSLFVELVEACAIPGLKIAPAAHSFDNVQNTVNLTDYDHISDHLTKACESAKEIAGCDNDELCIDITAGLKVFSAAATVLTLNSAASFCYVGTFGDSDEGKVVTYNARLLPETAS